MPNQHIFCINTLKNFNLYANVLTVYLVNQLLYSVPNVCTKRFPYISSIQHMNKTFAWNSCKISYLLKSKVWA